MMRDRRSHQPKLRLDINWSEQNLKPFRKNFYVEHENVANMTTEEVKSFRLKSNMIIYDTNGKKTPNPFRTWNESGLPGLFFVRNLQKFLIFFEIKKKKKKKKKQSHVYNI